MNKEFARQIDSLAVTVAEELGLGPRPFNIAAQLSKLLLETSGCKPYNDYDNNKQEGKFASLVVTLPSICEGGEVIVRHQGMTKTLQAENSAYSANYVAYFSNCKHDLLPPTSGYRLSLIYHIISLNNDPLPQPASNDAIIKAMDLIHRWTNLRTPPSKARAANNQ